MNKAFEAWNSCEPIIVESMGRSAVKVEDIEAAISRLEMFEKSAVAVFEASASKSSGSKRLMGRSVLFFTQVCRERL